MSEPRAAGGDAFAAMSTEAFAAETLARANDVDVINNAVWFWAGAAYVSFAVPVCLFLFAMPLLATKTPTFLIITIMFGGSFLLAVPATIKWIIAIRRCARYAKEMDVRATELKRRTEQLHVGTRET